MPSALDILDGYPWLPESRRSWGLDQWADEGYVRINNAARRGKAGAITRAWIDDINKLCRVNVLAEQTTVFRGINHQPTFDALIAGKPVTERGYMGTTLDLDQAWRFAEGLTTHRSCASRELVVEMHLSPGCVYLPMHISSMSWDEEREILTGPGLIIPTSVKQLDDDASWYVVARVEPLDLPLGGKLDAGISWTKPQIDYIHSCITAGITLNHQRLQRLASHADYAIEREIRPFYVLGS